jgi:hypothetical protein
VHLRGLTVLRLKKLEQENNMTDSGVVLGLLDFESCGIRENRPLRVQESRVHNRDANLLATTEIKAHE